MSIVSVKHRIAATGTFLGLSKACFFGGVICGVVAVCIAATIPNAPKPKFPQGGGRRYL